MYRQRLLIAVTALLAGCSTTPDLTNDPRGGGFFGGLVGVTRGDYRARTQERKDALDSIDAANHALDRDNRDLEKTRDDKAAEVARLRHRVADLDARVRALSARVASLDRSARAAALERRVADLRRDTTRLKGRVGTADPHAVAREVEANEKAVTVANANLMALVEAGGGGGGLRDLPR